ncbi:MAG: fibronectin type III domain-containing protein [Chloroflexota bacterium]
MTATNGVGTGPSSSASPVITPRTVPGAPTGVSGVAGAGSVQVAWTAPGSNGGSAITGYTATAAPGGATCTVVAPALTCAVGGLNNGTAYTFTVVASNAAGPGAASAASASVTPRTVPNAPTGVSGTPGNTSASVSWNAPGFDGGAPITAYTVTASPGGHTCSWTSGLLECTVNGLVNGQAYTFTVSATNVAGTGAASAASGAVTPIALPGQPTGVSASLNALVSTSVDVAWTAPADDGGSAITGYTATAYEVTPQIVGPLVAAGACSPAQASDTFCTISGLARGASIVVRVTATTAVGTGLASDPSSSVDIPVVLPTASLATLPYWSIGSTVPLAWAAAPGTFSVASYNVRYRRQAWNVTSFSAPVSLPSTASTSTTFAPSAGVQYCFSVQAVDDHGNAGPWSGEKCTTTPLDDRSLARKGSWGTGTGSSYYRGTWLRSTALGASSYRTLVKAKRLVLVASTCSTCGTVKVYLGSTLLKTISLKSTTAVSKRAFVIATWSTVHSGTVTLKLSTSGRKVLIDGLGVSRM